MDARVDAVTETQKGYAADVCSCAQCAGQDARRLFRVANMEEEQPPSVVPFPMIGWKHTCGAHPTWHKTPWMTGRFPGHWWIQCACGEHTAAHQTSEEAHAAWVYKMTPRVGHDHAALEVHAARTGQPLDPRLLPHPPPRHRLRDHVKDHTVEWVPWIERTQPLTDEDRRRMWAREQAEADRWADRVRDAHPADTHVPPSVHKTVARFLRYTEEEKIRTVLAAYGLRRVSEYAAQCVRWADGAGATVATDQALHHVMTVTRPTTGPGDYQTRLRLERAVLDAVEKMAPWTNGLIREAWEALAAFMKGARP